MKLQYKIALLFFITALALLALFTGFLYYSTRNDLIDYEKEHLSYCARNESFNVSLHLQENVIMAQSITQAPIIKQSLIASNGKFENIPPAKRQALLKKLDEEWKANKPEQNEMLKGCLTNATSKYLNDQKLLDIDDIGEIFLINRYGVMVASTNRTSTFIHNYKYWWKPVFDERSIFIDDSGYDKSVESHVLGVTIPVFQYGEIIGILKCNFKISGLFRNLQQSYHGNSSIKIVIARLGGTIIYQYGNHSMKKDSLIPETVISKMNRPGKTFPMLIDGNLYSCDKINLKFAGGKYTFGGTEKSIANTGGNPGDESWIVMASLPEAVIVNKAMDTASLVLKIGGIIVLLMVLISIIMGNAISRPFNDLARGAIRIGQGHFDTPLPMRGGHEVKALSDALTRMITDLQAIMTNRDELITEVRKRREIQVSLRQHSKEVQERVKELNCLYQITALGDDPELDGKEILHQAADLLPQGWQYPDITAVRISFDGKTYNSRHFKNDTPWHMEEKILLAGKEAGKIEIFYNEPKPDADKGPFLKEEQKLLLAVSEELSAIMAMRQSEHKAEQAMNQLEYTINERNLILDGMSDLVTYMDPKHNFIWVNKAVEEYLHVPREKLIGKKCTNYFHGICDPTPDCPVAEALQTGKLAEALITSPNDIIWNIKAFPHFDSDNKLVGIIEVKRDVTLEKEAQQKLLEAKQKAEEANRLKNEFIANISHEIRTPLSAIIGMTEIMLDSKLSADKRELLETVLASGNSLKSLVEDLLDMAKIESDHLEVNPMPMEMARFMTTIEDYYRKLAENRKLDFDVTVAKDVPEQIVTDELRLQKILSNLIDNAIKFTPEGKITIEVESVSGTEDSRDKLLFKVSDTGIGIPEEKQEFIFDPFTQVDGASTRRYEGVGMGLAMVRKLTRLIGGSIFVKSAPNKGSCFILEIPVNYDDREVPLLKDILPEPETKAKPLKILVAEDDPNNQKLIMKLLKRAGHIAAIAANGKEAVHNYTKEKFDIILMDVQMPIMNGLDACKQIRKIEEHKGNHIPIIALTAYAREEEREVCMKAGMDEHIPKPIDKDLLFDRINALTS